MNEGFYKYDNDLLYAPNFVSNASYELFKETHTEYTYPIDGWYWFASDDEAYLFFGLEKPVVDDPTI